VRICELTGIPCRRVGGAAGFGRCCGVKGKEQGGGKVRRGGRLKEEGKRKKKSTNHV
jgi:hypothetical protein